MKKITLLGALFCAIQLNVQAQITSVPDDNFEQRLIDIGIDSDGILNDQILTADAEAVTGALTAINRSISDFTGIEAFVNITGLDVSYNPITVLNVSTITGLTYLNTEGCTGLTSVVTTGLTSLTEMHLPGSGFTTLDTSTNTGLQILDVRLTKLISLDLSGNSNLVSLLCNNSIDASLTSLDMRNGNNASITTFDADNNGNLLCIFVDDASQGYLSGWSKDGSSNFVNNEGECNTLTIENQEQISFNLYPNPAKNIVNINSNVQESQFHIYDITGKLVLNNKLFLGNNTIDLSKISSGVYLVKVATDTNVVTKKLLIN